MPGEGGAPADAASTASARSGSRLKARWSAAPDGRRLFRGWYDSLLATDCTFVPASDGVLRCLPADSALLVPALYYADSACTAPVVESGRTLPSQYLGLFSCSLPAFIRQYTSSGCDGSRGRIFRRGPEVTGNTIFTKRPTPSCDPTFIVPGTAAFSLGEEIPATSFVKATRTPQPPAAGDLLQAIYLEAEDGARQPTGWQPVGGSENCRLLTLTDQRLHCLTATARAYSTYTDASCTEPAVYVSGCGPVPMFAEHPEPMTCPPVYSVRTVGQRLDRAYTHLQGLMHGNIEHRVLRAGKPSSHRHLPHCGRDGRPCRPVAAPFSR